MGRGLQSAVERKALAGERLLAAEVAFLLTDADLHWLGGLAHDIRTRKHSDHAFFALNRHINPTNICRHRCRFCSFRRDAGDEGAYLMQPEGVVAKLREEGVEGVTEFHVVGSTPPADLADYGYYRGLLTALKAAFPHVHLKAYTAVEIAWMAELAGMTVRETLADLRAAGLDAMPGGGAEIFAEEVRALICPEKLSGEGWLEVHRTAHRLGIPSNATMLYGHVETPEHKADHLLRLFDLQEETGGFQAFIPLAFHPQGTRLGGESTTGVDDLRHLAASRIALHNFPHIKAYWVAYGLQLAQVMLLSGADDLEGTVGEERIYHSAGATSPSGIPLARLAGIIRGAGLRPVLRDALYRVQDEL